MATITTARAFPIGELSRRSGVNIETIRYYEKIGLVPTPSRARNNRRTYGTTDMRMLSFVRRGRELGFTLSEIRALLALGGPGKASCGEVREVAAHHLAEIRAKIADLNKLERLLAKTIAKCSGSRAPQCPVIEILDVPPA
jgi:MerR family mercuric resistance operon transcriptional regulator